MATPVIEVRAADQFQVYTFRSPIGNFAGCRQLKSIKLVIENEVDDTGHRVGAVNRRCATGQHFNPSDQSSRQAVRIHGIPETERNRPRAIDQHQGAILAEPPQINRRRAEGIAHGCAGRIGAAASLWQSLKDIFDHDRTINGDLLRNDRRYRS